MKHVPRVGNEHIRVWAKVSTINKYIHSKVLSLKVMLNRVRLPVWYQVVAQL